MKKKYSLLFQMTVLLFVFTGMVLGLIYLFQTAFLDDFYSRQKIRNLNLMANNVADDLLIGNKEDIYNDFAVSNEVCIRVVSNNVRYTYSNPCYLNEMSVDTINQIADMTIENEGEKLFDDFRYISPVDHRTDNLYLYAKYLRINDNDVALIMVSSIVTPLDVTVKTLKSQYGVIVMIVIAMTLLLAGVMSKLVLKPVEKINNESKKLAMGGYDSSSINTNSKEFEELNATLNKANEDIQAVEKTRKELMANVSHDLRTPLTMIVGYGEMIRDIEEENNEENINVIINEAQRLSDLVNDILLVSEMENSQIELKKKEISAERLLKNVYHQYIKYCESSNTSLILNIEKDVNFMADEGRIEQVLYNFINNALNYNDKDDRQIELGVYKLDNCYRIYVKDNGEGIEEKDIEKIWDRYYKVDKQHKRFRIGSGIGLSVCKEILKAHKFNYGVESEPGKYSQFYFDVYEC